MKRVKILLVLMFLAFGIVALTTNNGLIEGAKAFSTGPPPGATGGPAEESCMFCHGENTGPGHFDITGPPVYVPGATYQIQVRHTTTDMTRVQWGFEVTALSGLLAAGTFSNLSSNTQTLNANSRFYIEHTLAGTFPGQAGGATWTFNWIAPSSNVGTVILWGAGNQANGDGTSGGDQIYLNSATIRAAGGTPANDFDGDGKTDVSVFRPSSGAWFLNRSRDGIFGMTWGISTDKIVPADYDGDGKTDVAVFRPSEGRWYIFNSATSTFTSSLWGNSTDIPAPADYDGDGKADVSIFRPSDGNWWLNRTTAGTIATQFGQNGDIPAVGDYDGDGKSDIGIFRPSNGVWFIRRSTAGDIGYQFGFGTDKITPADYDGDGKTDIAIYRPSTGQWFIANSGSATYPVIGFGAATDIPTPGDYDGDGKADVAIFRPSDGNWWLNRTSAGLIVTQFGQVGDKPTPNAYGN